MVRPSKYEPLIKPRLKEIEKWRLSGLTFQEIADQLGVSLRLLTKEKRQHSELFEVLNIKPKLSEEQLNQLKQREARNRGKYFSSTKAFIKNQSTPEERLNLFKIILERSDEQEVSNFIKIIEKNK